MQSSYLGGAEKSMLIRSGGDFLVVVFKVIVFYKISAYNVLHASYILEAVMLITTMSTKGQLIIPSTIRHSHDWHSGVQFSIVDEGNQLILKPISAEPSLNVSDVAGCIKYKGPKVSIDKISKAPYALARKVK